VKFWERMARIRDLEGWMPRPFSSDLQGGPLTEDDIARAVKFLREEPWGTYLRTHDRKVLVEKAR